MGGPVFVFFHNDVCVRRCVVVDVCMSGYAESQIVVGLGCVFFLGR